MSGQARRNVNIWRALRSRNYRLFFGGQGVSLIGTWMTRLATSWLVYSLAIASPSLKPNAVLVLGVVGFCGQIPTFLFAPIAGVIVDRTDRHRVLVITQVLAMLQSFALAALALTGVIQIWHVLVLSIVQGIINAFDMPARQAFVVEMVEDKADLPNAIALNSSLVNAARLIGPSVAGIIIAKAGVGPCFFIDGVSYIAVIVSLLLMVVQHKAKSEKAPAKAIDDIKSGLVYAFGFAPIRSIILLLAGVSLVGMPYTVLMPVFATQNLHGGAHTLGFLMASSGCGALAGALWMASRDSVLGLGRTIAWAAAVFGAGIVAFGQSTNLYLSMALLFVVGAAMMQQMAGSNTILQTIVEDGMRGRVMSFYAMAFMGMAPFGSLLAGTLANKIGPPETLIVSGLLCVCASLWFAAELPRIRTDIRPIYMRKGILPEAAVAVADCSELSAVAEEQAA